MPVIAALSDGGLTASVPHIRATHPLVAQLVDHGRRLSPTFAGLLDDLEDSDLIVYVEPVFEVRTGPSGAIQFAGASRSHRFVRVRIVLGTTTWPSRIDERRPLILIVAHELQHAKEVAQQPIATEAQFEALYRAIGIRIRSRTYETLAAQQVEQAVWRELHGLEGQVTPDR